jgi:PST family polysaccharide transporter
MDENYSELNTEGLKKKAVKGAGINAVMHFISFLFHTGGVIVLARLLTPKDFGLVAMVTAFSTLPMNFGLNGFLSYIIQKQHLERKEINAIFWVHVYTASFLAFCFVGFGIFLVYFYSEPALGGIAAAMATSFILVALFTSHTALLRREMKFASVAIGELIAVIVSIALSIAAAIGGLTYWAVVVRQLTASAVVVIASWILCSWRPSRPRDIARALPGFKYALKVYGNFTIGYLTKSIDKVLLGKFYGAESLGTYDRAHHLSALPAGQLLTPLTSVVLATLSRLQDDKERFTVYYLKTVSMVSFLGTIAAIVLMLSARDLVPLLLGPGWSETGRILMVFSPGIGATLIYGSISWLHLSLGTPGRWLRWNIISTIITIISFIIAARFGAMAMAATYSATMYILVLPGLWYAGRPIELSIIALLRSIWPYFIAGLTTALIWFFLPVFWPQLNDLMTSFNLLSRVIIAFCISPLLYLTILIIMQRSFVSIRELITLLKIFLSR